MNIVSTNSESEQKANAAEEVVLSDLEKHSLFANNQKLGLCHALLRIGDWKTGKELMYKLPEFYAVMDEGIANQLYHLTHCSLSYYYQE